MIEAVKENKRKPANIERIGGLNKRDRIWAQIRVQRKFSVNSLHAELIEMTRGSIHHYLRCLSAGGYVEKVKNTAPANYVLIKDCGIDAPRLRADGSIVSQGRINENMWRTMKILKTFDWMDLSRVASTDEIQVKPVTAKRYVETLFHARYLICVRGSAPGERAVYRFRAQMNTGNRAPMIQSDRSLYDPNLGKIVYQRGD